MSDELTAVIVIQVLGRPAEHVAGAINGLVEKLGNERGVNIINKTVHEPESTEAQGNEKLFLAFTELEILFESFARLSEICFNYMPSSVEIIRPAELKIRIDNANSLFGFLLTRLHQYDAVAKRLTVENMIMQKKLGEAGILELNIEKEAEKLRKNKTKTGKRAKKGKPGKKPKRAEKSGKKPKK